MYPDLPEGSERLLRQYVIRHSCARSFALRKRLMCLVDVGLRDEASPIVVSELGSLKNLQAEHACHLEETWEATHYQAERACGGLVMQFIKVYIVQQLTHHCSKRSLDWRRTAVNEISDKVPARFHYAVTLLIHRL